MKNQAASEYFWEHGGNTLHDPIDLIPMMEDFSQQQIEKFIERTKEKYPMINGSSAHSFLYGVLDAMAREWKDGTSTV